METINFKNKHQFEIEQFYKNLATKFESPFDAWKGQLKEEREVLEFQVEQVSAVIKTISKRLYDLIEKNVKKPQIQLHDLLSILIFEGEKLRKNYSVFALEFLFQQAFNTANPWLHDTFSKKNMSYTYRKLIIDITHLFDIACEYQYKIQKFHAIDTITYLLDTEKNTWPERYENIHQPKPNHQTQIMIDRAEENEALRKEVIKIAKDIILKTGKPLAYYITPSGAANSKLYGNAKFNEFPKGNVRLWLDQAIGKKGQKVRKKVLKKDGEIRVWHKNLSTGVNGLSTE